MLPEIYIDKTDQEITKLLNSSRVQKIEGVISNFRREVKRTRYGNVTTGNFLVDTVTFAYTDALVGRFNSFSKTNSGVFYNGLPFG